MAANDLPFNQLASVLTSITNQATGKAALTATNTGEFVSVAQTALKTGYDPLNTAISQVLSRTIFSARPYQRKFQGLEASALQYGNHVRKLNMVDKPFVNDDRLDLVEGASIDQQVVNKPDALQTNFYGANVYEKFYTVYKDQLDMAFTGPDEFQRFLAMYTQNTSDMIEQAHETTARATLVNFIAGKITGDSTNVIYLLDEYNTETGSTLTATTAFAPGNVEPFMKWVYARIAGITAMMQERSLQYHINVTNKEIMRHTPSSEQRIFLYAPYRFSIRARVLADVFNTEYLNMAVTEEVNYWQSIKTPNKILVKPTYMDATGDLLTALSDVSAENIFGVIMDREAAGYTVVNQWAAPAPFNARGGYTNHFYHFTDRYWNDFTENGVVLMLTKTST